MAMTKKSTFQGLSECTERNQDAHRAGRLTAWLALVPVLLLSAGTAWAGSAVFGTTIDARPAARFASQPAQFSFKQRSNQFIAPGRRDSRRLVGPKKLGSISKSQDVYKKQDWQKQSSSRPQRDPPDRKPPHGHRHRPHLPPLLPYPETVAERAQYLASLPRRVQQPPQGQVQPQTVARQILVLINQNQPQSLGNELARVHGLERLSSQSIELLGVRAELFRVRGGRSDAVVLAALQRDGRVRSAQFNRRYFHSQGARHQTAAIPQYGPLKIRLPDAHQLALGRKVVIAVINSGVDTAHPDLKGAVVRSYNAAGSPDTAPDFHGTAVAGIIRARGIVEGVAPQAEILAVRAFRKSSAGALPETNTHILLTAIDWAVKNGARVLNMSFVGSRDAALQELLEAVSQKRIVLVAAAGNAGPRAPPAFPAAYPGVIAVTAVDEADRRYQHANRGGYIAVAAPGWTSWRRWSAAVTPICRARRLPLPMSAALPRFCWSAIRTWMQVPSLNWSPSAPMT